MFKKLQNIKIRVLIVHLIINFEASRSRRVIFYKNKELCYNIPYFFDLWRFVSFDIKG